MINPPNADVLLFLTGSTLTQVCLGENEIVFRFDNGSTITAEDDLKFHSTDETTVASSTEEAAAPAASLLGQSITAAELAGDPVVLTCQFSNGTTLETSGRGDGYESFVIRSGDKIFVA